MADETSAAETPAAPVVETPPAPAPGPWQSDIEQTFADPQVRATVDAFLRSKIQPRMTQLEQQASVAKNAQQLWDAFQEDPAATYAAITTELYGEEVGRSALEALEQRLKGGEQTLTVPVVETPPEQPAAQIDPRIQQMLDDYERQRELEAYDAALDEVLSDPANADINRDRIHQFVAAADGDFNQAIAMYREDAARARTEVLDSLGLTPEQIAELTNQQREQAPAVMGSEVAGNGAPPPTTPQYRGQEGLDRAIDDAVAQMRRNAEAPPVS